MADIVPPPYTPGPLDRITYNGDKMDEVVASNAMVHIEAMGWHNYMIALYIDGRTLMLHGDNVAVTWEDKWPVGTEVGPDLTYYCHTQWQGEDDRLHQCDLERPHSRHRCECGRVKKVLP